MTCSLCWTSLCAACLYIITRPDLQFLCTRVYKFVWFSVAWGSATFWWLWNVCNCSTFCACTRSGSPHNVVHSLVIIRLRLHSDLSYQLHCLHYGWQIFLCTLLLWRAVNRVSHVSISPSSDSNLPWNLVLPVEHLGPWARPWQCEVCIRNGYPYTVCVGWAEYISPTPTSVYTELDQ